MTGGSVDVLLIAYNEAETIVEEVSAWHHHVTSQIPGSRIVVAEDGSSDGTTELLAELGRQGVIEHNHSTHRRGYRGAFFDGLRSCQGSHVLFADTGAKFDVRSAWSLWPYRDDYDLIIGRKVLRTDSVFRRMLTWGYNSAIRSYFDVPKVHDADAGLRLMSAEMRDWLLRQEFIFRDLVNSEIVIRSVRSGWRYAEFPVLYHGRNGKSRGLPTKEIPQKVVGVLRAFPQVKRETSAKGRANQ